MGQPAGKVQEKQISEKRTLGKYDHLKVLKETRARVSHVCSRCGGQISPGDTYYREHIEDKFLHTLHAKKYCGACYGQYGEELLVSSKG